MRLVRAILTGVCVAVLAMYALDCFPASTPDEAMQCCDSMPCPEHSQHGSQNCCQTMPSSHAEFVQPHSPDIAPHAPVLCAFLPVGNALQGLNGPARVLVTANSHAPPLTPAAASTPLRV